MMMIALIHMMISIRALSHGGSSLWYRERRKSLRPFGPPCAPPICCTTYRACALAVRLHADVALSHLVTWHLLCQDWLDRIGVGWYND